jgi:uncharacterized protein (DUF433 family)
MSYADRARAAQQELVRHFGGDLRVTLEQVELITDRMAGTQMEEVVATYPDVPATDINARVADDTGATRRERQIRIAGADIPGVDLLRDTWRLTLPSAESFLIPRPIVTGDPTGSAPILWSIPRVEGAAA